MRMNIKVSIEARHARSLYEDTKLAIEALARAVEKSSESEPALGGALVKSETGEIIGSYIVEFE